MRRIYSLFMYFLTPYLIVRLWLKGRHLPAYRQRVRERFALNPLPNEGIDIWVHAVSLGEVIAATPLIYALLEKQWRLLITTMTPTGSQRVIATFANQVQHQYIPYDLPWSLRRFFKKIKPRLGLIMETELWPNLIYYAAQAKVPLLLVNARLSERSYRGYNKIRFLCEPMLNQFNAILTQGEEDAKRFKSLGAEEGRVHVLGNMKFDLQTQHINLEPFLALKDCWGAERVAVMIASTHEQEEQLILSRLKQMQVGLPNMILLIAPRHPERFQKVYQLSVQLGFNTGLRSQKESLSLANEVVILNSLGELLGFYKISDYAFVGGSFVPIGGHNVLEPIAMGVPVFSGPHVHNFKAICRDLEAAQAIELVENADVLIERLMALHRDQSRKKTLIEQASAVLDANKGAVTRYLSEVERVIATSESR